MVVSGCNRGANLGAYTLGRSGTISAAVEASFFDVPAIAVSLYIPADEDISWKEVAVEQDSYGEAVRATEYLLEHGPPAGVFERADYLNVNVPLPPETGHAEMEITHPSRVYEMTATHEDGTVTLHDGIWERMANGDIPDPEGTDRRAIVEGRVSVSPLTAPHTVEHHEGLDALAETYTPSEQ
jgi:5'-nucleotidase